MLAYYVICTFSLLPILVVISAEENEPVQHILVLQPSETGSPLKFPHTANDPSTPILLGSNPKSGHLPPKMFPKVESSQEHHTGPPILTGSEVNITRIKNDNETIMNATFKNVEANNLSTHEEEGEEDNMLHTRYKGGEDVDELLKPQKKATEKDEKKTVAKKEPKSQVEVNEDFDKSGPKLMNDTKANARESMMSSTSQIMAVSSSVLSSTQPIHHGIIEPAKTIVSVVLSAVVIICLGAIGLLVWKRITQRRHRRDVLINEDDMDDVADMHTFDRAQIQIT